MDETAQTAERDGNDLALSGARSRFRRRTPVSGRRGRPTAGAEILTQIHDGVVAGAHAVTGSGCRVVRRPQAGAAGDRDTALPVMRAAADHLFEEGRFGWCVCVYGTAFSSSAVAGQPAMNSPGGAVDPAAGRSARPPPGTILDITVLRLRTAGPRPW